MYQNLIYISGEKLKEKDIIHLQRVSLLNCSYKCNAIPWVFKTLFLF